MLNLSGKKALITGGSRGIGRAIAEALSKEGCEIAINYLRNKKYMHLPVKRFFKIDLGNKTINGNY